MVELLRNILKQEDTVLFIGSGVSLWSGLPSWAGMIKELAEYLNANGIDPSLVNQELERGDLLQAASYGFDRLTKQQIAQFIRTSCRLGLVKPHEVHRKIISLGPSCYVTTNYDNLLELSFTKWLPDSHFSTVVNRQLIETAEIVGSRAKHFLFKLHGDAQDSDSIVLTREQYRALNPGGELHHAQETIKTLMLSRPVIYVGFGLRDPDFLYLKDLLANTFKGGARDHYAIMADISVLEKEYWRRNFGIHIASYNTIKNASGNKDHSPLLELLDELKVESTINNIPIALNAEVTLKLARHAANYMQFQNSHEHLPLVAHTTERKTRGTRRYINAYSEQPVEKLLDGECVRIVLTGLPGGGKSYSLRSSVGRFANQLHKECLADTVKQHFTTVPIYIDLKLYQGNILDQIEQNVPVGISLNLLIENFKVRIYLDAFNEIPREYIESSHWRSDFAKLFERKIDTIVISSRTSDALGDLDFTIYNLDTIEAHFVEDVLQQKKIEIQANFKNDVLDVLRRPLFFKLIFSKGLELGYDSKPHSIYNDLLTLIKHQFETRFNAPIDVLKVLSDAAMFSVENGEEVFKVEVLRTKFTEHSPQNTDRKQINDFINWLISQEFLVPIFGERICFFHQSITEYLAAIQLSTLFTVNNVILKDKMAYNRWDNALFLTLSLLDESNAKIFLEIAAETDFPFTLASVRYMEGNNSIIITQLLERILKHSEYDHNTSHAIGYSIQHRVPTSMAHFNPLSKIVKLGNVIGASAVARLVELTNGEYKREAFKLIVEKCNDFNFCTAIGRTLDDYILLEDISRLREMCDEVQQQLYSGLVTRYEGFDSSLGSMMRNFDPHLIYKSFYDSNIDPTAQQVCLDVLCDFLKDNHSNESLKLSLQLLVNDISKVIFPIHMITSYQAKKTVVEFTMFTLEHVDALLSAVESKQGYADWSIEVLSTVCSHRKELAEYIWQESKRFKGILKAALIYSSSKKLDAEIFESLEYLLTLDSEKLSEEPFSLLSSIDISWVGHEVLLVKLLKLRNSTLAYHLCDLFTTWSKSNDQLILDIGPIEWWLNWFEEFVYSGSQEWMFTDRVPSVLTRFVSKDKRMEIVQEFNRPDSKYREILSNHFLPRIDDLKLEDISIDGIEFLLRQVGKVRINHWNRNLLVELSTEDFVQNRLIPLLEKSDDAEEKNNIAHLIHAIGKNHKRRYLIR
jgi:hypothetical protein